MKKFIYEHTLYKDGQRMKKVYLLQSPEENRCDCCDETKQCASVNLLCNDVCCICEDCLELILDEFYKEKERKKLNKLDKPNKKLKGDKL